MPKSLSVVERSELTNGLPAVVPICVPLDPAACNNEGTENERVYSVSAAFGHVSKGRPQSAYLVANRSRLKRAPDHALPATLPLLWAEPRRICALLQHGYLHQITFARREFRGMRFRPDFTGRESGYI
jgi:hypothetical protein